MSAHRPAVLGGRPAFPEGLRLLRPSLPAFETVRPELERAFASGILTKGPTLADYERRLAEHLGTRHAVAVSSCTLGLMLVLDGFGGGEAIMPSFTFMATAMAALRSGLTPVFADIRHDTWCLDARRAEEAITPHTRVIMPVHLFGNPADSAAFEDLSRRTGIPVVYDAAHGFGALEQGRPVGGAGLAQAFSTSPTKLLITAEGGVVATDDDEVAARIVVGREYGNDGDYDVVHPGVNARLSELGAALGTASLDQLEQEASRRNRLAAVYRDALAGLDGIGFQTVAPGNRSSYKDLSVRLGRGFGLSRDALAAALTVEGIQTRAYYVPPAHRLTALAASRARFEPLLPETNALADEVLTLPMYGSLTEAHVERVGEAVLAVHAQAPAVRRALGESGEGGAR